MHPHDDNDYHYAFWIQKKDIGIESDRQIELRILRELKKSYRSTIHLVIDLRSLIQFKVGY